MNYKTKTSLILPFKGSWMVANGGRTHETNNHIDPDGDGPKNQRFACDFFSRYVKNDGKNLEDYGSYGAEVIAPGDGIISEVIDEYRDLPVGESDEINVAGNMVIIDHENGEWSVLSHLKYKSIRVKVEDRVKQGDTIGLCGNTGNTSEPHVHYHLQDDALIEKGIGLPIQFSRIKVDDEVRENYEPVRNQRVENI